MCFNIMIMFTMVITQLCDYRQRHVIALHNVKLAFEVESQFSVCAAWMDLGAAGGGGETQMNVQEMIQSMSWKIP